MPFEADTPQVFLRRLEYYNGILFLTTNRIGKIDPAVSSRIHLILNYKRLGPSEIEKVFLNNIKRLRQLEEQHHQLCGEPLLFIMEHEIMRFAEEHCKKHPKAKGAWNGRQIRNAFVVAASLARYEAQQPGLAGSGFQPQLRYSHFQEVERLMDKYNQFRVRVLGGDDSRKARLNEERDDDFDDDGDEDGPQNKNLAGGGGSGGTDLAAHLKLARLLYSAQRETTPVPSPGPPPHPVHGAPPYAHGHQHHVAPSATPGAWMNVPGVGGMPTYMHAPPMTLGQGSPHSSPLQPAIHVQQPLDNRVSYAVPSTARPPSPYGISQTHTQLSPGASVASYGSQPGIVTAAAESPRQSAATVDGAQHSTYSAHVRQQSSG
jgi:hypothetical protein